MIQFKLQCENDSIDLELGEDIFEILELDTGKHAKLLMKINDRTEWVLATFKKNGKRWILDKSNNNIVWDHMYCVCGRTKVVGPKSIGGNVIKVGK